MKIQKVGNSKWDITTRISRNRNNLVRKCFLPRWPELKCKVTSILQTRELMLIRRRNLLLCSTWTTTDSDKWFLAPISNRWRRVLWNKSTKVQLTQEISMLTPPITVLSISRTMRNMESTALMKRSLGAHLSSVRPMNYRLHVISRFLTSLLELSLRSPCKGTHICASLILDITSRYSQIMSSTVSYSFALSIRLTNRSSKTKSLTSKKNRCSSQKSWR